MLKLLKYEFKRRKRTLIAGGIALVVAEGFAIYLLYKQNGFESLSAVIMGLMLAGAIVLTFLDVVLNYYADFKKVQGTMLFLTPKSGREIVGSKMIFAAIELLTSISLVLILSVLTNTLAVNLGYEGVLPAINEIKDILSMGVGSSNLWWIITGFAFLLFLQYLASQSIAISSITVGRTLLSRNSYNWLWAILLFIGINIGVQTINGVVIGLIGLGDGLLDSANYMSEEFDATINITKYLVVGALQYLAWIVISFFVSSRLLNKRIDI